MFIKNKDPLVVTLNAIYVMSLLDFTSEMAREIIPKPKTINI